MEWGTRINPYAIVFISIDMTVQQHYNSYYKQYTLRNRSPLSVTETIGLIKIGKTDLETKAFLDSVHRCYKEVYNNNLSLGYNGFIGPNQWNLN